MYFHFQCNIVFLKKSAKNGYNLNFHPFKVVTRYRDPQLQMGENNLYLFIWDQKWQI